MKKSMKIKAVLILLLPLGLLLNSLSHRFPRLTEKLYTNGLYRVLSWLVSRLTGWLPFSVAEFLLFFLIVLSIWYLIRFVIRMIQGREKRLMLLANTVASVFAFVGILYFSFVILWGMNYNRLSLGEILNYDVRPASGEELKAVAEMLVSRANELRGNVPENSKGVMVPDGGIKGAMERALEGYTAAAEVFPQFKGAYSRPKPVALSHYMAYTNIWGIYSPFTVESNVNTEIPLSLLPATIAHEMAHQRGFAREDEANYIAYVVCRLHPDVDFQYSGVLHALTYVMDNLYRYNRSAYYELRKTFHEGINRDLRDISEFHKRFESPARDVASKTNDMYLKANKQEDGERSYGRMVDLLIAEYRMKQQE